MAKHIYIFVQDTEYTYTCLSIHSLSNIVCMYVHDVKRPEDAKIFSK